MKKKISAIVISSLLLAVSLLSACKNGQNSSDDTPTTNLNYTTEVEVDNEVETLVSEDKRLHRKTITEVNRPFVQNGTTDYVIIVGSNDANCSTGASFFSGQIRNCTGVGLPIYKDVNQDMLLDDETLTNREIGYTSNAKYIVFSHEKMEEQANIQWATDVDLRYSGYMIKTVGDTLFVKVNTRYGYQPAVLSLCRDLLGYEWYSVDTIVYTKDGSTLPDMDIVERRDIDFSWLNGLSISPNERYAAGVVNVQELFIGPTAHTSFTHVDPKKYNNPDSETYHPLWYATARGQSYANAPKQLCYSAHGDRAEYEQMLQTAFTGIMAEIDKNEYGIYVDFSREDAYGNCECEVCNAISKTCGTLNAAIVMFTNDLSDMIQAELQKRADEAGTKKREVLITMSAYQEMDDAPMMGTAVGNYEYYKFDTTTRADETKANVIVYDGKTYELPYKSTYEDGLRCKPGVSVDYSPIEATFEESFYHPKNEEWRIKGEKWELLTDNPLGNTMYTINHDCTIVPFKVFDVIAEHARYLVNIGVGTTIFMTQNQRVGTGFNMFVDYLGLTLHRDVNQNVAELTDKYFENYFGAANGGMRQYYESLVAYMKQLEVQYPQMFYTAYKHYTDVPDYWPLSILQGWLKFCDQAYEEIEPLKISNPERYAILAKHIKIETLFPRYMICEYYGGYYSNTEILQMRQDFCDDCKEVEFTDYNFYGITISSYFEKWGVS